MKVYIVFENSGTDWDIGYDRVVKVFADEGEAARFILTNKQYWYDKYYVE